jgi:hypothetical protein
MAMDAGVAGRNLATNSNYELPSSMYRKALDTYTTPPQGVVAKGAEALASMLVGGAIPGPQSIGGVGQTVSGLLPGTRSVAGAAEAPAGFMDPRQAARLTALQGAQKEGYVVAPSSTNPTVMNRALEGISGKLKLQQLGSEINQGVTQRLGAEGLGQNPSAVLTPDALKEIANDAFNKGYVPLKNAGEVTASDTFGQKISSIIQSIGGANKSFPALKGNQAVAEDIGALSVQKFDSSDAVDAIKMFRDKAGDAFGSGNKSAGRAYKDASNAIEAELERHLAETGQGDLLSGYTVARKLIAQTHSTDSALTDELGTISARKFGAQLGSGVPLEGQQRTIGSFAQAFPKVNQVMTDSQPSISPLDAYGSIVGAAASHSVAPLAYPLTRVAIRNYLLSEAGQARAIPTQPMAFKPYAGLPGAIPVMSEIFSGQ